MTLDSLIQNLKSATDLPLEIIHKSLTPTKDLKHGDIAFPCFVLAKEWGLPPVECAKKLAQSLTLPSNFSKLECSGPYLNFFLDRVAAISKITKSVLSEGERFGRGSNESTIVIDFSSPNIAKPFHIGHLRTTIIGFSLGNLLRHLGHKVVGVNHLGDWGTQFGFVYAGCNLFGKPEDDMNEIVARYVQANMLRKAQEKGEQLDKLNVNEAAREYFRRLEAGDSEAKAFWQWSLDVSLAYYNKTYKRMGITFEEFAGESFYFQFFDNFSENLQRSGILEDSRGALGVDLGEPLGFARLLTEDGRTLYLTRDVITADYRETTYHPEAIIYVVGAPQTLHFKQLQAILQRLKHPAADKIVHVPFGHVPGISTRNLSSEAGDLSLDGLLDEAHERAREAYQSEVSKRPEGVDTEVVAEAVGLGAIYFNYLSRTNIKEFHFSWDEALNFKGDTGPYLMYAVARLYSMQERAKQQEGLEIGEFADGSKLVEEEAWELASTIARFPEVLVKTRKDLEPCNVCTYALDLAKAISRAYVKLRVLGEPDRDVARARLGLYVAAREVLGIALRILGIKVLERM
jgi:arginyl-tRNA synthetase